MLFLWVGCYCCKLVLIMVMRAYSRPRPVSLRSSCTHRADKIFVVFRGGACGTQTKRRSFTRRRPKNARRLLRKMRPSTRCAVTVTMGSSWWTTNEGGWSGSSSSRSRTRNASRSMKLPCRARYRSIYAHADDCLLILTETRVWLRAAPCLLAVRVTFAFRLWMP